MWLSYIFQVPYHIFHENKKHSVCIYLFHIISVHSAKKLNYIHFEVVIFFLNM